MSGKNYGLCDSLNQLEKLLNKMSGSACGFDIETGYLGPPKEGYSLHPETNFVAGISFTDDPSWARYVPLAHDNAENVNNRQAAKMLWPWLNEGLGVAHNVKFELRTLSRFFMKNLSDDEEYGDAVRETSGYFPFLSDSMLECYSLGRWRHYGLKFLAREILDYDMTEIWELFPDLPQNKRKTIRFNTLDLSPQVVSYACEDSAACLDLNQRHYELVKDKLVYKAEIGVVPVLCAMEDYGIAFDWGMLRQGSEEAAVFGAKLNAEIQSRLTELTGEPVMINLGSSKQLSEMLFDKLGFTVNRYTASTKNKPAAEKKMSTDALALKSLSKTQPVVQQILEWKNLKTLSTRYLDKFEDSHRRADGHAHPNFSSAIVITGRYSSSDPNCLPGSYEVLTPYGWERLDKLPDGVPVAQYNNDESVDFVVPSRVVREPYDGEMVELRGLADCRGTWQYTPNHRIVFKLRQPRGDRKLGQIKECTAAEWYDRLQNANAGCAGKQLFDRFIPLAGFRSGGRRLTEEERRVLRLAICIQADGTHTNGHQYDIAVTRTRKVSALFDMGLEPKQQSRGRWRVQLPDSVVSEWLYENKSFRAVEVLSLCSDDLHWFVSEVMQWDGDSTRGATYLQNVSRRADVELVQAAAVLCGLGTSLYENTKANAVAVNIYWRRPYQGSGIQEPVIVSSPGTVYCVEVPSGMFLCRNDSGRVIATGNSQNLPKKYHLELASGEHFDIRFRDSVVAPTDHYILGFDYGQAELRGIAGEAQEHALLASFAAGEDVHAKTASLMLGLPLSEITDELRSIGKTCNFAILYGLGVDSLSDRLGITKEEAQRLMDQYFEAYPAIKVWSDKQVRFGKEHGYVLSKYGRRMPIWEFESTDRWVRQQGERQCVNYPIQASATGDIPKIAMVRAHKALAKAGLLDRVHLFMNIHDALEYYVHRSVPHQEVIDIIQPAVIFPVPGWPEMVADWHIGLRWGAVKPLVRDKKGCWGFVPDASVPLDEPEFDPDEPEEIPLSADARAVLVAASDDSAVPESGKTVIVSLSQMPDQVSFLSFARLAKQTTGSNKVRLRTPDGLMELPFTTGLGVAEQPQISLIFSGASVEYEHRDVQSSVIGAGLKF